MTDTALFERLWDGTAGMEDWTAAVSHGAVTPVADNIITVHCTFFSGAVTAIRTIDGLVLIDTAGAAYAQTTLDAVRAWDKSPIHTVIYTHGHIDHTSGISVIDADADAHGVPRPRIVAHRHVQRRMQRYAETHGYNTILQAQQFNRPGAVHPIDQRRPDQIYDDTLTLSIGGEELQLIHARGETDDATYVWLPKRRVLASGDFVIWMFPNAGNPRKVQRYAAEWAVALRRMAQLKPLVLIPGHGPVVFGEQRAAQVLSHGADVLEYLTTETLVLLNQGATLDRILHAVKIPTRYTDKPYLRPAYDDPEFLVRAIYYGYAGWFDGNPAHLKPATDADLASELARLTGGADTLAERAAELARLGQTRLAVHLSELASTAAPESQRIQSIRAAVLRTCIAAEPSLMAKAFYAISLRDAEQRANLRTGT